MPGPMRDSLSRCESNPYSLYSVKTEIKREPASPAPSFQKDTIQASKEEIRKEALERLRHTSKYLIIQVGFMRIGKYLFLGITLPPYLLIYGIPKWLVVTGLPFLLSLTNPMLEKVFKQAKKQTDKFCQKVVVLFEKTKKFIHRTLIQPVSSLILYINHTLSRFKNRFNQLLKLPSFIKKRDKSEYFSRLTHLFKEAQQKISASVSAVLSKMQVGLKPLKRLSEILKRPVHLVRATSTKLTSVSEQLAARWQASQKIAYQLSGWIFQKMEQAKPFLHQTSLFLKSLYQRIVNPISTNLSRFARSLKQRLGDFLGHKKDRFFQSLYGKIVKLKSLATMPVLIKLSPQAFSWMPQFLRQLLIKFLTSSFLQGALRGGIKLTYGVLSLLLKIGYRCESLYRFAKQWIQKATLVNKNWLRKAKGKSDFLSKVKERLRQTSRRGLHHSLVFMVMINLILLWGIELVGEITTKLLFSRNRLSAQNQRQDD